MKVVSIMHYSTLQTYLKRIICVKFGLTVTLLIPMIVPHYKRIISMFIMHYKRMLWVMNRIKENQFSWYNKGRKVKQWPLPLPVFPAVCQFRAAADRQTDRRMDGRTGVWQGAARWLCEYHCTFTPFVSLTFISVSLKHLPELKSRTLRPLILSFVFFFLFFC